MPIFHLANVHDKALSKMMPHIPQDSKSYFTFKDYMLIVYIFFT